jgi:hypothetical protein
MFSLYYFGIILLQLETKYTEAIDRISDLEKQLNESLITETELKKKSDTLEKNITDLLVTARAELQRKDREISDLRYQKNGYKNFMKTSNIFQKESKLLCVN